MSTSLKALISKLGDTCRQATERAASLCMARGNHEVDIEHLLLALLELDGSDLRTILRRCDIDPAALERQLNGEIACFNTGNQRTPVFSAHIARLFAQAWLIASLEAQPARIRSGHLLLALLTQPELAQLAWRSARALSGIPLGQLKHNFEQLTEGSLEARERSPAPVLIADEEDEGEDEDAAPGRPPSEASRTPALERFTSPLTERARKGELDPVIGRDAEIRQLIDILLRRRQNNPILTGEAGVGKTAIVEGLALRLAAAEVPAPLLGIELHVLDLGLLQAGASVRGEFENRLRQVIDEVRRSPRPIVLFIDEAHTLIGAGGQHDAANLLKPALARGELRTIAATTWAEYKKYFEKDAALARRFQVVKVEEPSEPLAAAMLRGMVPLMERHFGVRVLDEAVTEAVRLSHRYLSGRQLPDKAISVLDTACAQVALGHSSTPAALEELDRQLQRDRLELAALRREEPASPRHAPRIAELEAQIAALEATLATQQARFEEEKALVADILLRRSRLEQEGQRGPRAPAERQELEQALARLRLLQGERPLVPLQVDGPAVAGILATWTGIPLGSMLKDELATILQLETLLQERIIGQPHALAAIARRVRTARANLEDPHKPKGVFLFTGPSGVGKTETALALADLLYGGERKMLTFHMSEYQEAHSVSGLKGSPPGYVGYGEGGALTEAVRRTPYSVLLLDEIEKAHPDVLELFFQVFDKGVLDDAEGREIDFRNTLIILTSNVGAAEIMAACAKHAADGLPDADALAETLRPALSECFTPAFLGRLKVVPYYPISDEVLARIITLKLERIAERIAANHRARFTWDPQLVASLRARCTEADAGARNVDHILAGTLLPEIAEAVLARIADGAPLTSIRAGVARDGQFHYAIE